MESLAKTLLLRAPAYGRCLTNFRKCNLHQMILKNNALVSNRLAYTNRFAFSTKPEEPTPAQDAKESIKKEQKDEK